MRQKLHRFALSVAAWELAAILIGGFVTSSRIVTNAPPAPGPTFVHEALGAASIVIALAMCVWASLARARHPARGVAWVALAALAMSGATAGIATMSPPRVVIHAIWSHVAFGLSVVVVMLSSDGWSKPAVVVSPGSWTALRPAALVTPLAVLAQIAMGALYRHQILGVMPHMFGALAVALLTLVVSVILLQNFAEHRELKRVATILISIVLAQVCLGIAAFLMLLLNAGNVPAFAWLATAHVTTGSLTFGAGMAAAMQVRRSIAPR